MSYSLVQRQRSMSLDERRNQMYAAALEKVITPDSIVLDLGSGLGIHGLLAAKLGAKQVYMVEPEDVITVAEEIAAANGYGDRVKCFQGTIEQVELPESVDIIISVFTGNFLLEEDLLPSLFYARDRYLKPGGVLIPEAAIMEATPICAPDLYNSEIEIWSRPHLDLNHHVARSYASHCLYYYKKELYKTQYLAQPVELMGLDFQHETSTNCQTEVTCQIQTAGLCHGWAGWFRMLLGDQWLSTAPHEPPLHWSPAYLPLDPPITVTQGEEMSLKLQRPPQGDWTWTVKTQNDHQQKSTFFAVPTTLKSIKQTILDYAPELNEQGEAAAYVLSQSHGKKTVEEISYTLLRTYPQIFLTPQKSVNFVQNLVRNFT